MEWLMASMAVVLAAISGWWLASQKQSKQQTLWQAERETLQTTCQQVTTQLTQLQERERLLQTTHDQLKLEKHTLSEKLEQRQTELQTLQTRLEVLQHQRDDLQAQLETLTTTQRQQWEKDFQKFLNETLEQSRDKLEQRSTLIRQETTEHFGQQMKTLVTPLETLVKAYEQKLTELDEKHLTRINTLDVRLQDLTRAKDDLVNVLKMNKGAGTWGELELLRLLETAGLQQGTHFEYQALELTEDGSRAYPDIKVRLPEKGYVYVDAKTLRWTQSDWQTLSGNDAVADPATSPQQSLEQKARHLANSLLTAAKELGAKNYPKLEADSATFVVLFVPRESMLSLAHEAMPDIVEQALRYNVVIATPINLIGLLRIIEHGWRQYSLSKEIVEIQKLGTALHEQLATFGERFEKAEKALTTAQSAYQHLRTAFDGKQGLTGKALRLSQYGCKSAKQLPKSLQDSAADPDNDLPTEMPVVVSPELVGLS